MRTARCLIGVVLLIGACRRHESPTEPTLPNPMGALGDSTFSGRVLSAEGPPVENAHLVVHRDNIRYEASTDANGSFRIGDMGHGLYAVDVYVAIDPKPFATTIVDLKRGDNVRTIVLPKGTLPTPGCGYVSGYVTEEWTDVPIPGAQISFFGMTKASSSDGFFLFELGCPPNSDPQTSDTIRVEHPLYIAYSSRIQIRPVPIRFDAHLQRRPI
ncbi:MAG TPA: carboxypeptidase-like regulatory domain-containing protein [Thermoanaerobaculia bacterium]|nr:carboxypeptidase-like regulatory domain-containing protein [Thermoanaerobaculia bacterium]